MGNVRGVGGTRRGAGDGTTSWTGRFFRSPWAWAVASALVAAAMIAAFVFFYVYQESYRDAARRARITQLTASEASNVEWRSIAAGRVPPGAEAELSRLLTSVRLEVQHQRPSARTAAVSAALDRYVSAVDEEFRLIKAGRISEARQLDATRVDPAYNQFQAALGEVAATNRQAADTARTIALGSQIGIVVLGLAIVWVFSYRFTVSRRALAEAEVQRRLLLESNKAKSHLISVVSHDLRTPLTAIVGYLEIMQAGEAGPLAGEQREFLAIIERNVSRLLTIVNDLLFISRAEEGRIVLDREEVSLGNAAGEAVEAQRLWARTHEINLRLTTAPAPRILADRRRVDELIENLLSNAVKFTPPGGTIEVSVVPVDGRVRVEVSDTGAGISPEDQEHLFERFFRSREMIGTAGTGLGLAIVKAIADAHGATIDVSSALGEGSSFRVDFPAAQLHPGLTAPAWPRGDDCAA